ncbi:hypothetical protein QJS10_CPA01g03003 [Acorus calamus]|uniref:Uncharacterized protein n=1 Tax=Acorus calamus TaxID=4465 RepID=A0AAV9FIY0_ACOCL|nr:hypothetical protein QJS10_CPA01g03003 [Acorus calamus]
MTRVYPEMSLRGIASKECPREFRATGVHESRDDRIVRERVIGGGGSEGGDRAEGVSRGGCCGLWEKCVLVVHFVEQVEEVIEGVVGEGVLVEHFVEQAEEVVGGAMEEEVGGEAGGAEEAIFALGSNSSAKFKNPNRLTML